MRPAQYGGPQLLGRLVVEHPLPPVPSHVFGDQDERDWILLVRRPGPVEHVEVGHQWGDERPIGRLHQDQRNVGNGLSPELANLVAPGGVVGDVDGADIRRYGTSHVQCLDHCPVDAGDRDHDAVVAVRLWHRGARPHLELAGGRRVLVTDEHHHRDQQRDEDQDHPGPKEELLVCHDDEDHACKDGPEAVDQATPRPAGAPLLAPVDDHAGLREGEADEDADRIERNERIYRGVERVQHADRHGGKDHDSPGKREPVAPERELARHALVLGQDGREAREGIETGVAGQEKDHGGTDLQQDEQEAATEDRIAHLAEDGRPLRLRGHDAVLHAHEGEPDEDRAEQHGHDDQRVGGVLGLGRLERGDAVGDGLDAGKGHRAAGEGLEQQQDGEGLRALIFGEQRRAQMMRGTGGRVDQADADGQQGHSHEEVSGYGEDVARFPDAPQVGRRDQDDDQSAQFDLVRRDYRECRRQVGQCRCA